MPPDPQRVRAVFDVAREIEPGPERTAYLNRACAGDQALGQRLEELLKNPADIEAFFSTAEFSGAQPARCAEVGPEPPLTEAPGTVIGHYKLREKIGEGGCGAVYVAEQEEPVRRRVALKVIKLGMDTRSVVARFEAERQALAMMDHPNIAKVLDAGATETGRPYFVMELVRGIRITDYCDQHKLPTLERLRLFIQICHAVQHAHQKGVIHRDLKPSNILVTLHDGVPVPKVIDFGIAKATEGRLTDKTVYTELHQFIGTPAYMSPEQAEMSGLDIDTRSDLYSLGVLLYELLTGRTPFDPQELLKSGVDEIRRRIREVEPPRPSTRLSTLARADLDTVARARGTESLKLRSLLRGDLDWIVMKCLEKDRRRRYETASGLALDIQRHVDHEPVSACPPSTTYRLRKFTQRHRRGVLAASAVLVAVVAGFIATTVALQREQVARLRAVKAERAAESARANEAAQRGQAEQDARRAEASEFATRRTAYASDMNAVQAALRLNNLARAQELLNRHQPQPGQADLRGWEWRYLWRQSRPDPSILLCREPAIIRGLTASSDGHRLAVNSGQRLALYDLNRRIETAQVYPYSSMPTNWASSWVRRAAFAPREPLLAFGLAFYDRVGSRMRGHIVLWHAESHRIVGQATLDAPWLDLAFSEDGQTLVTYLAGDDAHITFWSIPECRILKNIPIPPEQKIIPYDLRGNPTSLVVTRDLRRAAVACDNRLRVVDLTTGQECWRTNCESQFFNAIRFSPDGSILATISAWDDPAVLFWDAASGTKLRSLEGHLTTALDLAFWQDGRILASASADWTIRLWDTATGQTRGVVRGAEAELSVLVLLPDQKTLASGSCDGTVRLWDTTTTLDPTCASPVVLFDLQFPWCFSADSQAIICRSQEGAVVRRQGPDFRETRRLVDRATGPAASFLFSDAGQWLAQSSSNGVVQVWDLRQGKQLQPLQVGTSAVVVAAFPDETGRLLTIRSTQKGEEQQRDWRTVDIDEWQVQTGQKTRTWQTTWPIGPRLIGYWVDWFYSPRQDTLMLVGRGGSCRLLNLLTSQIKTLELDLRYYEGWPAISWDGRFLVVPGSVADGRYVTVPGPRFAQVWDLVSGNEAGVFRGFLLPLHSTAFSPDGNRLAAASAGQEGLKLFDFHSRQELISLPANGALVDLRFSADGNLLAAVGYRGELYLWRAPSWKEIAAAEQKTRRNAD
jgi:serine/threonine protein kinase/WD40 repeat protein